MKLNPTPSINDGVGGPQKLFSCAHSIVPQDARTGGGLVRQGVHET